METNLLQPFERQRVFVQGIVQGVGFRPFVYGLARELELTGFVLNDDRGVTIEIEGDKSQIENFIAGLTNRAPSLARVDFIENQPIPPNGETRFSIVSSQSSLTRNTLISPDVAICDDCYRELLTPSDRRFHYPFINCTNCGPRFTIIQDLPYDRENTTMRVFQMCSSCQAEYDDPMNRRFHAQPNACPDCGPRLSLRLNQSAITDEVHVFQRTVELLEEGKIIAIKGLGGYHLACDAMNPEAVRRLRYLKHREAKPFALMVSDIETASQLCRISAAEEELLRSRRRPIVLLEKNLDCPVSDEVAPASNTLGLMLPYTPLHVLLFELYKSNKPKSRPAVLVMTSGNLSDEPIAYRDDKAIAQLAPIVDGWMVHNREIQIRCDDSVLREVAGGEQFFRRSRGYAPEPIRLTQRFPAAVLACGGHLKNTFCLGREKQAFVSHHIGDLENLETLSSFKEGILHYQKLLGIEPEAIAYDLHPEYLATKFALESDIVSKIGVQHHHAHIASVLAEHGIAHTVIGVAADGTGYGTDGAIWGGEVMLADLASFERLLHLAYVPLPGGEQAIREPWRMAAVYLQQAYGDEFLSLDIPFVRKLDRGKWRVLEQMTRSGLNSPMTSSLGRLFDAVAALVGLREGVQYEGQAAIELETQATAGEDSYSFEIQGSLLDIRPAIQSIVADIEKGVLTSEIAGRFHRTIAHLLLRACQRVREQTGVSDVALSGGVFQNKLLLKDLLSLLAADGFHTYINRLVPPNDGGLSLGQAAVAAAQLSSINADRQIESLYTPYAENVGLRR